MKLRKLMIATALTLVMVCGCSKENKAEKQQTNNLEDSNVIEQGNGLEDNKQENSTGDATEQGNESEDNKQENSTGDATELGNEPGNHYQANETIKWAMPKMFLYDQKVIDLINKEIYESGIDCQIEFVGFDMATDEENYSVIDAYEEENGSLDIISVGGWTSHTGAAQFVESGYFMCLDDFLQSEDGSSLMNAFTQLDWKRTNVNGHAYTVPKVNYSTYDASVYIAINENYIDDFSNFDGSYDSLMNIYNEIGKPELKIAYEQFGLQTLYALSGYDTYDSLPIDEGKILNFGQMDGFKELCNDIEDDIKNNRAYLVDSSVSKYDENVVACVFMGSAVRNKEGMVTKLISQDYYPHRNGFSFGIRSTSKQIELAEKILTEFYSNEDIIAAVNGVTNEKVEDRNKFFEDKEATFFTEFIIDGDECDNELLSEYVSTLTWILSDYFDDEKEVKFVEAFEMAEDEAYIEVIDSLNKQLDH